MRRIDNNVQVQIGASTPRSRRAEKVFEGILVGSLAPILAGCYWLAFADSPEKIGYSLIATGAALFAGDLKPFINLRRYTIEADEYAEANPNCEVLRYEHRRLMPSNLAVSESQ